VARFSLKGARIAQTEEFLVKFLLVLIALFSSPLAFASPAPSPYENTAHCEGMVRGDYMILLINPSKTVPSKLEGILTHRDKPQATEYFNCLEGARGAKYDWTCAKTTPEAGTLVINIEPTPHGDWAELYVGPSLKDLTLTGTLDCRFE
jgi:hypothetical protein